MLDNECMTRRYFDPMAWSLLFVMLAFCPSHATESNLTDSAAGVVVEVKRDYCKIEITPNEELKLSKGMVGRLVAPDGQISARSAMVTTVKGKFIVVRIDDGRPAVGHKFLPNARHAPKQVIPALEGIQRLTGEKVTVRLLAGGVFEEANLLRIDTNDTENIRVRIRPAGAERPRTIAISAIRDIAVRGDVVFENDIRSETEGRRFSRKQAMLAKQHAAYQAKLKEWEQLLQQTGVRKWPELSADDHENAIADHQRFVDSFKDDYPNMRQYGTEHFMVLSNIAPKHLAPYLKQLDSMHQLMMRMYGIPEDVRVWKGKALVVAFVERKQFVDFETRHIKQPAPPGAYGVCHSRSDGQVVVACFRGERPAEFGQMLVHETSHGFMHRYKTPHRVPSWINEGLADHLSATIVPIGKTVSRRRQESLERIAQTRTLGGIASSDKSNIRSDQYGLSSLLVAFLIRNGETRFASLIDHLKAGLNFRESLVASYETTPEQMVAAFGASIGVPNLKP